MICSDICADAAGYIWPPIYQTVLVRGAAEPPNQVNRELFTAGKHPSRPITHLPWELHRWHRLTKHIGEGGWRKGDWGLRKLWMISRVEERRWASLSEIVSAGWAAPRTWLTPTPASCPLLLLSKPNVPQGSLGICRKGQPHMACCANPLIAFWSNYCLLWRDEAEEWDETLKKYWSFEENSCACVSLTRWWGACRRAA